MNQYSDYYSEKCREILAGSRVTYFIETYGCQMNVRDSESMAGLLESFGATSATEKFSADIILFNTCCIRDHAEKKLLGNIGALKKLKDENPKLIIGISGCMMQQKGVAERLFKRFPYVDFFIGTYAMPKFTETVYKVLCGERVIDTDADASITEGIPACRNAGTSAFVNIMYGCNNYCTYCIVPYVRGPERSREYSDIEAEIKSLIHQGFSEITLLGQNVNSYGNTFDNGFRFPQLLEKLSTIEGLRRIRFMTSHPKNLSPDLIRVMADHENICKHVHLPVQSGSDRILKQMNRIYDTARYRQIVADLRAAMPEIELTTDIIVGFPGETEDDFMATMNLVDEIGYANAFTFKYSPRVGTIAAKMPNQIPEDIKKERLERLNALQLKKTQENNEKYIGYCSEVLVEGFDEKSAHTVFGKYSNFKMVYFDGTAGDVGKYLHVYCDSIKNKSLVGHREDNKHA